MLNQSAGVLIDASHSNHTAVRKVEWWSWVDPDPMRRSVRGLRGALQHVAILCLSVFSPTAENLFLCYRSWGVVERERDDIAVDLKPAWLRGSSDIEIELMQEVSHVVQYSLFSPRNEFARIREQSIENIS